MSDYQKGFDRGQYSPGPSADFKTGTPEWDGAMHRESLERQRKALDQPWSATTSGGGSGGGSSGSGGGGDGAGVVIVVLVIGAICYFASGRDVRRAPQLSVTAGANYRVVQCTFTAADGDTHNLVDNEWVHVQKVYGQTLEVSAYRRPYNGQSVRGNIAAACIKSAS